MKTFNQVMKNGGIGVLRTDTLYGIVCDAHNQHAVERIYHIKNRNPLKPVLVLIGDIEHIHQFDVTLTQDIRNILKQYWPGKVSIILPVDDTSIKTHYIHKGTGGIAFRLPDDRELRNILMETGPLVAPSANPEGKKPATTISEARDYFQDKVDYYLDGGTVINKDPSKIIKISPNHTIETIRG